MKKLLAAHRLELAKLTKNMKNPLVQRQIKKVEKVLDKVCSQ